MSSFKLFAISIASFSLVACGSDPLTQEEAQRAWPATGSALSDGATSSGDALTVAPFISASYTMACKDGGNLKLSVNVEDILNMLADEFGYDVEFQSCQVDGLTIDGTVSYSLSITETTFKWSWEGKLDYDGTVESCEGECTVNGDCEFALAGQLSSGNPDAYGNPTTLELQYSGTICGHEAGAWLNVSTGS